MAVLKHIKSRNADPDTIPVEIIVRDNGIGIRPEFCSVMYEPFARDVHGEDGYPEGLGLGLPITKMLVEQMKGTIQMTSQVQATIVVAVQMEQTKMEMVAQMDRKIIQRLAITVRFFH